MCDKVLTLSNTIRSTEIEVNYLLNLLDKCYKDKNRTRKCHLIAKIIIQKESDIKCLKEEQSKNMELCNLYHELQAEHNSPFHK